MAQNSTYALDRATTFCFLLLQVTRFPLRNIQYPKSFSWTCLPILEDPFNCLKVPFSIIMHKLADHTNNIDFPHTQWFCSIGTLEVLHPNFLVSLRRSSTYFLWEIKIPCLEYATLIPRKYFSFPNSFISNCVANFSF
ncbi:hypothetical protein CR513_09865, partial [Mucuna pruriens]